MIKTKRQEKKRKEIMKKRCYLSLVQYCEEGTGSRYEPEGSQNYYFSITWSLKNYLGDFPNYLRIFWSLWGFSE